MKIWQRYFVRETLKTFFVMAIGFYTFSMLIDFSTQMQSSSGNALIYFNVQELLTYYASIAIDLFDVMLPFSMMIATIRTLTMLNHHNEWTTLLTSGLKAKQLFTPFIAIGAILMLFLYFNVQVLHPIAQKELRQLKDKHLIQSKKAKGKSFQHIVFEDESTLLFTSYDSVKKCFKDAFWVPSCDEFYHAEILHIDPEKLLLTGESVSHFTRNEESQIAIADLIPTRAFPEIKWNSEMLLETVIPPEERSLSDLWRRWWQATAEDNEKDAQVISVFYKKLILPWFALFAILAPAPFCVRISRKAANFMIYALSIFGFFAFFLILDAGQVLGERQVLPPIVALIVPFIVLTSIILVNWWRKLD